LVNADPGSIAMPLLLAGVTDGRYFSRLGIQTYGFTPMNLPPDFNPGELIHAADERIPAGAVEFGAEAMYQVLRRYRG
jgi:acetylornithine deacetylase/succinyl-diaminopimelate desuccinylase-like protein